MASATTGFRGLTSLLEGDKDMGLRQLMQMLISSTLRFSGVGAAQLFCFLRQLPYFKGRVFLVEGAQIRQKKIM
jgi:hypothetical protein